MPCLGKIQGGCLTRQFASSTLYKRGRQIGNGIQHGEGDIEKSPVLIGS